MNLSKNRERKKTREEKWKKSNVALVLNIWSFIAITSPLTLILKHSFHFRSELNSIESENYISI